jgi:hypothetical protein
MIVECDFQDLSERAWQRGYEINQVMGCICERLSSTRVRVDTEHPQYPKRRGPGPGTVLKAVLRKLGFTSTKECRCNDRAHMMNMWGPAGCRERNQEIVGWLAEEAKKRRKPFVTPALYMLVEFCCRRAERFRSRKS